jgi:hypothetical protein
METAGIKACANVKFYCLKTKRLGIINFGKTHLILGGNTNMYQMTQQINECQRVIDQLIQQTRQASSQYEQMLQQEQQNAQMLEQLAQRERMSTQLIQQALRGHQLAIQQMNQVSQICTQMEQRMMQFMSMNNQAMTSQSINGYNSMMRQ